MLDWNGAQILGQLNALCARDKCDSNVMVSEYSHPPFSVIGGRETLLITENGRSVPSMGTIFKY